MRKVRRVAATLLRRLTLRSGYRGHDQPTGGNIRRHAGKSAPGLAADLVIWSGDRWRSLVQQTMSSPVIRTLCGASTELLQRYLPEDAGMGGAYIKP